MQAAIDNSRNPAGLITIPQGSFYLSVLKLSGNPRQALYDSQNIPLGLAVGFSLSQQQIVQTHMEVLRHLHDQLQRSVPGTGFDLPVMGIADPDHVAELFLC